MKAKRRFSAPLLLSVTIAFQLFADQSDQDKLDKLLAETRAKAENGDASAQWEVGAKYQFGNPPDYGEAVKWYRKAAEQNHAVAQVCLAHCYQEGEGVAKDEAEAVKWYRKAAEQGEAVAQFTLALCYDKGEGIIRNHAEAVKWCRRAAEQNCPDAQNTVGGWYMMGRAVAKDYIEGYKWFLLAAAQGDQVAEGNVRKAERLMTQEQIAEGQKLARDFRPRKVLPGGGATSVIDVAETRPESSGSGFFISEDGYLVTNEHVVKDARSIRLVTKAGLTSAAVVKVDAANDLALLKAEGKFPSLAVAPSRAVRLGNTVATVGFPNIGLQGFAPKFAKGEIAALSGAQDDARYFQISVPVQPGNSGGALVDERGNVVGVVAAKLSMEAAVATSGALPENVNYAVKSSFLLSFLESVPEVAAKIREPNSNERKFEDVVQSAERASALVLVY